MYTYQRPQNMKQTDISKTTKHQTNVHIKDTKHQTNGHIRDHKHQTNGHIKQYKTEGKWTTQYPRQ